MKKPRRGAGGNGEIMKYEEIMAAIKDINGPWSNAACMGYCLIAMRRAGLRPTAQRRVLLALEGVFDEVVEGLSRKTGRPRFAWDSYRRFVQMYGDVVLGMKPVNKEDIDPFEEIIEKVKEEKGVKLDNELEVEDLKELVKRFKVAVKEQTGQDFPTCAYEQLWGAICAVFRSWMNERAILYRKMEGIPAEWGTAVSVQAMVFGNMGDTSATGVCFSRDAGNGEDLFNGEYLINAQGEDVVAGIRTPQQITKIGSQRWAERAGISEEERVAKYPSMEEAMPEIYKELDALQTKLENHYKDMQDMEFTIEKGKLFMLQTRNGKRTAQAALKIACDMVDEGMISTDEALMMVEPKQLDSLLHPMFDAEELKKAEPIASALPASPGAACGQIVFSAEEAIQEASRNHKVILVRLETSPEDIEGMHVSQGILTVRGGMTSHAAVVARGMGACCVSGCGDIKMHDDEGYFEINGVKYHRGDWISLDGSTGNIYGSAIKTVPASISGDFERFMNWADERRTLKVRTNADTPHDAKQAHEFGAQGIGLVRTEHMFFEGDRIKAVREMIVSKTSAQRRVALEKILPMQRSDFEGIYEAMEGLPVTIRFLDPPLHEFLPTNSYDITQLAKDMHIGLDELKSVISSLHEFNPMMGHRGCRLAISYPEIAEMQTTAVIQAALAVNERHPDWKIEPEIMIPLVGDVAELRYVKKVVCDVADKLIQESELDMKYHVGTMIEIPRAALLADEIAKEAEFFSFGTNDLTQMTFGFSRDDAGGFLQDYYDKKIFESDPFAHLDQRGVGKLVKMATELGRSTRPNIKLGICGEHGGDPASIEFCHRVGLNYVSCSPYRVPIARLAAAQAAIKFDK